MASITNLMVIATIFWMGLLGLYKFGYRLVSFRLLLFGINLGSIKRHTQGTGLL
jgi:hypothetical protein